METTFDHERKGLAVRDHLVDECGAECSAHLHLPVYERLLF